MMLIFFWWLMFSFVAMLSSEINFIDDLSYRQIQYELKKRRLKSIGKKNIIVKRLKIVYQNEIKSTLI